MDGYFFIVTEPFLYRVFHNRPPFSPAYVSYMRRNPVNHLPAPFARVLADAFSSLAYTFADTANRHRDRIISHKASVLYMEISNYFDSNVLVFGHDDRFSERKNRLFSDFLVLLKTHARREHTVEFYAGQLCITPQYLSRIVGGMTGLTAYALISNSVLAEAKQLLSDESLPLQTIVHELRFSDQAAFTKFFKRLTGMTPLQYRKVL